MAAKSSSTTTFSKPTRGFRRWLPDEDAALISAMMDMHNVAKPHIESKIRTFKKEWGIIYDMINGTNTSGFGWDDHRKLLTVEDKVWDDFLGNEREAPDDNIEMESNNVVQDEVGLYEMDVSTTPSMSSKRRRKSGEFEPISAECIIGAAKLLDKVQELDTVSGEIDGLTEEEIDIALSKITDHPAQMLVFCSLPPHRKLAWVSRFLSSH
ncbi:hypothetical protein COLO4_16547 [Corchorus olitorius]|uniref:Myb/SANT-like domain-containing protein n=1 Tax=Corchorus olitorius TaxID=93759 RepID=A0A1R3JGT9_9ROSI|nr:hypothetical protein COLO4_16547 [Corchorus olitorius]